MDGLFELLIILAIFVLPALEAWAKKRKKEERRRREEGGGGAPSGPTADQHSPGAGMERGRPSASGGERERRGAEVLLPEDLWEELTGERPREGEGQSAGAGASESGGEESEWEDAAAAEAAGPEEPDSGSRVEAEPAPWRETGRAEAGPGAADLGGRMGSGEFGYAGGETLPAAEGAEAYGTEEPRRADVIRESGSRSARPAHVKRIAEIGRFRPGRAARRGAAPAGEGDLHPLIGDLDRKALRRAVVYAEILGPPVSQREG